MPELIRIAHVAMQLQTGGMERLLVEFARHVDRSRFALVFIALGGSGSVAKEIQSSGWPVLPLGTPPGVRPSVLFRLANLFREHAIDLVHSHNTKPLIYAGPAAKFARVRGVIHTRHGQRHGSTPRQDLLFRLASRCADRIVCVSENSRALSLRDGLHPDSLCAIRNGIDRSRFHASGPQSDGPAVFVGRLSPEKDVAGLLHAVIRVRAQAPLFRLRIAGTGPCETELKQLAESLGLSSAVEFLGEVSDIPSLLTGSSLLVLPSRTEGLPVTVLEAMASGLPVVATNVGGTAEAVEHGTTGFLVPPGQPAQLAEAILKVYQDHGLALRMGQAGVQRAAGLFDVKSMVSNYQSLYQSILGTQREEAA